MLITYKALHGQAPTYIQELLQPYVPSRNLRSSSRKCVSISGHKNIKRLLTNRRACFSHQREISNVLSEGNESKTGAPSDINIGDSYPSKFLQLLNFKTLLRLLSVTRQTQTLLKPSSLLLIPLATLKSNRRLGRVLNLIQFIN